LWLCHGDSFSFMTLDDQSNFLRLRLRLCLRFVG
jgi:hypothetical protein